MMFNGISWWNITLKDHFTVTVNIFLAFLSCERFTTFCTALVIAIKVMDSKKDQTVDKLLFYERKPVNVMSESLEDLSLKLDSSRIFYRWTLLRWKRQTLNVNKSKGFVSPIGRNNSSCHVVPCWKLKMIWWCRTDSSLLYVSI